LLVGEILTNKLHNFAGMDFVRQML